MSSEVHTGPAMTVAQQIPSMGVRARSSACVTVGWQFGWQILILMLF
jgi:hypothetical protein